MRFRQTVIVLALTWALGLGNNSVTLNAQVAAGTIQGTISDALGAVVPDASIIVRNLATGEVRKLTTTQDGFYSAPNLLPGEYEISASAKGFTTQKEAKVSLAISAVQVVNFALRVGSTTEVIDVSGAAAGVDVATSGVSGVIGERRIRELPLNGRDWTQLATLEPGVSTIRTENALGNRVQQGEGTMMTISGGRPWQNNYRLDGTSINDYSNGAPGSALGTNLGVDAVEEFSVLTSNYPAEYGRSSGGVINAITRSGTNKLHGTAYNFHRNSALDASNYFDVTKPPFHRNQFGASGGGPIIKDRTFVFGDYEGIRQSLGTTQVADVPTADARLGNLSTGPVQVNPASLAFINAFYPLPNRPASGDTGQYAFSGQQITHENYFTIRADHKISGSNSLFGTLVMDRADTNQPDELNNKTFGYLTRRYIATIQDTQTIGSRLVNSTRVGFNRVVAQEGLTQAINPASSDLAYSSTPGLPAPQVTVPGLTAFTGGLGGFSQHFYHYNSYQFGDDAFLTTGSHSLKAGLSIERIQNNEFASAAPDGNFKFGSLRNFLLNQPTNFVGVVPGHATERGIRESVVGAYFEDDWRFRPSLTLNMGLRYEMSTVPTEVNGKLSTLRSLTDTTPHLGDPFFNNPTLKNFEPRIGLAWDPSGKGKTAVRAGFGLFDVLPLPYLFELITEFSSPFYQQGKISNPPAGSFPGGAFPLIAANSNTLRAAYVDPNPPRDYVMHWNLNIQQELAPRLTAMIAYVGSRGVHQPGSHEDLDTVLPTLTSRGYLYPDPGTATRINENFGRIGGVLWNQDSYYHALEVRITKAMSHNVQIQGAYTWSKSIDTGSTSIGTDAFGNSLINPPFFAGRQLRSLSDFDQRHNLVVHYTWVLDYAKSLPTPAQAILGGWQLGGIVQASSGVPFSVLLGGDPLGQGTSDNTALPDRVSGPGCSTLTNPGNPLNYIKLQCFSYPNPATLMGNLRRNSLIGPGLLNLDMSLFKNNRIRRISEDFTVQFRVEAFNLFNHANFAPPLANNTVFDESGAAVPLAGRIDATATPSREIQFGLKLIW